jgi:hypothetical protein
MKQNYYCLVSGLPDITIDDSKSQISIEDYINEIKKNTSPTDFELIKYYLYRYDNQNLLQFLENDEAEIDRRGNFSKDDLEDMVSMLKEDASATEMQIPDYLRKFIPRYLDETPLFPDLSWENQLTYLYYTEGITSNNAFIQSWFEFEMNIYNILSAFNCRKYDLEMDENIIGDNEVAISIKTSNSKDFGLSQTLAYYDELVRIIDEENLAEKEKKLDQLKWEYVSEHTFFHYFSVEKLFGYLIKLEIVNRWLKLNKENGEKVFRGVLERLENSYEFPEEFLLNKR